MSPSLSEVLIGATFGRWTVLGEAGRERRTRKWLCRCECGTTREVRGDNLARGRSVSCGCYPAEFGHLGAGTVRERTP